LPFCLAGLAGLALGGDRGAAPERKACVVDARRVAGIPGSAGNALRGEPRRPCRIRERADLVTAQVPAGFFGKSAVLKDTAAN